jgi:hypothetical protein
VKVKEGARVFFFFWKFIVFANRGEIFQTCFLTIY